MSIEKQKIIIKLYIGYFNRAGDTKGLNFWEKSYDIFLKNSPNKSFSETYALKNIALQMATVDEYKALYPASLSNDIFLERVYLNFFGRTIDEGGKYLIEFGLVMY
jgi:hypothetical protein